ncbi:glycoside hydrolase [Favolaschia claudopus]|uniref:glucan 1,3-beta-glucosidase n=1 Tax=Favolaschia claudopus TaxID=2862362 RepID=A0AAW0CVW9_9AGAR
MSHWQQPPLQHGSQDYYAAPHYPQDYSRNESSLSLASNHTYSSDPYPDHASQYADSVYALNPGGPGRPGYDSTNSYYHDEQSFQPQRNNSFQEKRQTYIAPQEKKRKRVWVFLTIVGVFILLAIAGGLLYSFVFKKKDSDDSSSSSSSNNSQTNKIAAVVTGSDGSTVTADDGSTFTYNNPFGGTWYWDATDPFNNGARPNSWTPALNETFNIGVDKIRGVNLGGWLVTEPFIVPGLYQTVQAAAPPGSPQVIDEYTLLQAGGQAELEKHYDTFITEKDFMQIAAAGLNFVRIPIGYWAIEVLDNEGFLPRTSWNYFLKAIGWARKYGIRINLDLHALPGSQNGWNHSGRLGGYGVLFGPMGVANAQRSLDYIRILAEFISQPEYKDVIPLFGITNEPQGGAITQPILGRYYVEAYNKVRLASGLGAGNGPYVSFHDGFIGPDKWAGFLPNADRASLDFHPYLCFGGQSASPITQRQNDPCDAWGATINNTMQNFGFIVAGEFSNAVTDCGTYVNGVGQGSRYDGTFTLDGHHDRLGSCEDDWLNYKNWDQPTKDAYKTFAKSSMDALQNFFFWTWKIGPASSGNIEAPHWSYSLGLQEGWMPTDPREAVGQCGNKNPFAGSLQSWQTGGAGAGQIPQDFLDANSWPPPFVLFPGDQTSPLNVLPTYAPVGTPITMPGPQLTAAPAASGKKAASDNSNAQPTPVGWTNQQDSDGMMRPVPGCFYYDPYVGTTNPPPAPLCTNAARGLRAVTVEAAVEARATPPPAMR